MSISRYLCSDSFAAEATTYASRQERRSQFACVTPWVRNFPGSQKAPGLNGVISPSPNFSQSPRSSAHPSQGHPPRSLSLRNIAATTTTVRSAIKAIMAIAERDAIYLDDWSETVVASKDATVSIATIFLLVTRKVHDEQTTIRSVLLLHTIQL